MALRSAMPVMPGPTADPTIDHALRPRAVTEAVSGYTSLGCYQDNSDRVLNGTVTDPIRNYPQFCCDWCVNLNTEYTICGVENGVQCFCDSTTYEASSVSGSRCNSTCAGEGTMECGGFWYVNLYSATAPITTPATYTSLGTKEFSEFSNVGCFSDYGDRILRGTEMDALLNEPEYCCEWCINVDNNNQWCGVENGNQCFCGSTTFSAISASAADCSLPCPGAPAYECGASWRINIYQLTGVLPTIAASTSGSTSASADSSETSRAAQADSGGGLSGGAIAGVVVGVIAVLVFVGLLAFFLVRRRRSRTPSGLAAPAAEQPVKPPFTNPLLELPTPNHVHELQPLEGPMYTDHEGRVYEMDANR